jgi:predicted Zn-dependent protease
MICWPRSCAVLLVASLALAPACSQVVNPATGRAEYTTLGPEEEARIGAQEHPRVLAQYGGAYQDPELQAYVEKIGERLAAASELPGLDFTFTLLDSDVVNAFALPGGYVYVTRGLVVLAENEAELAGVLGHEIGHVTGRHTAQRQTRATGASVLATLGTIGAAILGGQAAGQLAQQVAGAGVQAYVASYSRDQELEADQLGIRYLTRSGYEPRAMATFLEKLNDQAALDRRLAGVDTDPAGSWFATHPRTLDRVEQAIQEVGAEGLDGRTARDEYLARIDGMIYGENPDQGVVRGREFVHPALGFAFTAPPGFRLVNTPSVVLGQAPGQLMKFDMARVSPGRSMPDYVTGPWAQELKAGRVQNVQSFEVNGMPAASAGTVGAVNGQPVTVGLAAIRAGDDQVYRFLLLSAGQMSRDQARAYEASIRSFRRLSPEQAARFQPKRLRIVEVQPGESGEQLARRMAVDAAPLERFRILNELALRDGLRAGERVKLVVE